MNQAAGAAEQLTAATEAWEVERSSLNAALAQAKSEAAEATAASTSVLTTTVGEGLQVGASQIEGEVLEGVSPDAAADVVWAKLRLFAQNYGKLQTLAYFSAYAPFSGEEKTTSGDGVGNGNKSSDSSGSKSTLDNKAFKRALVAAGFTGISNKAVTQVMKTNASSAAAIAEGTSPNESKSQSTNKALNCQEFANVLVAGTPNPGKESGEIDGAIIATAVAEELALQEKRFTDGLTSAQARADDLEKSLATAKEEEQALQESLRAELAAAQARADDLENNMTTVKEGDQLLQESLRAELAAAQARADELEKSLSTNKEEEQALQESLRAELATAQTRADDLVKSLSTAKEEDTARQESLRAELATAQARADDLEKSEATVKDEEQALRESLVTLKMSNEQAQTQVLQMQEELTRSQAEATAAITEAATSASAEANVKEAALNGKLEEALAAEKDAKEQCAALSEEVSKLSLSLTLAQEKVLTYLNVNSMNFSCSVTSLFRFLRLE